MEKGGESRDKAHQPKTDDNGDRGCVDRFGLCRCLLPSVPLMSPHVEPLLSKRKVACAKLVAKRPYAGVLLRCERHVQTDASTGPDLVFLLALSGRALRKAVATELRARCEQRRGD